MEPITIFTIESEDYRDRYVEGGSDFCTVPIPDEVTHVLSTWKHTAAMMPSPINPGKDRKYLIVFPQVLSRVMENPDPPLVEGK